MNHFQLIVTTRIQEYKEAEDKRLAEIAQHEEVEKHVEPEPVAAPATTIVSTYAARPAAAPANVVQINPVTPPTLRLGQIGERLGFQVTADFLKSLGFEGVREKGAVLFHESSFDPICEALKRHISGVQQRMAA